MIIKRIGSAVGLALALGLLAAACGLYAWIADGPSGF